MNPTTAPSTAHAKAGNGRMAWVDTIKATSVVLVLFMHTVQTLAFVAPDAPMQEFWTSLNYFLEPLRMPIFFLVSGMLASSAVKRPWNQVKSRTIGIFYLYLLWHTIMTVFVVIFDIVAKGGLKQPLAETVYDYTVQIFITPGGYWYFFALVAYFVIAKLVKDVNPWLVMGVALSLNLARPLVSGFVNELLAPLGVSNMFASVPLNAVYFLAGVYLVRYLRDLSVRGSDLLMYASGAWAIGWSLWRVFNPNGQTFIWISIAWIVFAILLTARITERSQKAVDFGKYVGPRTLPIFVLQFPALHVMYWVFGNWGDLMATNPVAQFVYPLAFTALVTFGSLKAYDAAMTSPTWRHLFAAPKAWVARPAATAPAATRKTSVSAPVASAAALAAEVAPTAGDGPTVPTAASSESAAPAHESSAPDESGPVPVLV